MQRIAEMRQQLTQFATLIKKSNQKLYELTYIDGLTGVSNRRAFDKGLVREWNKICRLEKPGKPFSLIMIDIDKFKFFNDHYGHKAGDECLQKVAQVLKEHLRRSVEMLCRYGGEEFVVLLPSLGKDEAMKIAETLRKSIQAIGIAHAGSGTDSKVVTISLGVSTAMVSEKGDPFKLLSAADLALYEAKEHGRNQVAYLDPKEN